MSRATTVHLRPTVLQACSAARANRPVRLGSRKVGWVEWLDSFQAVIDFTDSNVRRNFVTSAL